jgi:hypothetical protein
MKTYTINVELETKGSDNLDFLKSIINKANDEKLQYQNCVALNLASTKLHREILEDTINSLNEDLKPFILNFEEPYALQPSNSYNGHSSTLTTQNGSRFILNCVQGSSSRVDNIKYSTYVDEPTFYYKWADNTSDIGRRVEVKDILKQLEGTLLSRAKQLNLK